MTSPGSQAERAARQVFEEQESNARATAGAGPRDEDRADELAVEAGEEETEDTARRRTAR